MTRDSQGRFMQGYNQTHGLSGTSEYNSWENMRGRCNNPNNKRYSRYGGRDITIYPEWDDFPTFLADMGPRPKGPSLDRVDNNKGYYPENCRWATPKEQSRNNRRNRNYTYKGKTQCLAAWAEDLNINRSTLRKRIDRGGYTFEEAIEKSTTPKTYSYNGESLTLRQWALKLDISHNTLYKRVEVRRWSMEKAFSEPIKINGYVLRNVPHMQG